MRTDPGVESVQPTAELVLTVKKKGKISADKCGIPQQRSVNRAEPAFGKHAVRMKEEENVAVRGSGSGRQLRTSSARSREHAAIVFLSFRDCRIPAATIDDNDLM